MELKNLQQQKLQGTYWSMQELEKRVNRKYEWIKENILYPSQFRSLLDVENGGSVFYPKIKGQTWTFQRNDGLGYSLLLLGLTSGMRFGELVGLQKWTLISSITQLISTKHGLLKRQQVLDFPYQK
ncbi:DUF771 domain-containing protein [Ureibacillus massiliensis]|uniref:DUF771 domain-containing protein n=1 Tax=Ureibacillus massiliensis TaxID=292806 RepID=UPI000ACFB851